jgi:secreted trypsin-like serine protease
MKKMLITLSTLLLTFSVVIPAQAVENGEDATGNAFVVPITWELGNGKWAGCTGTLIAPSIVVTAGHCVLDVNGLLTKNVYVGQAGSSQDSITLKDKVASIQITSTFQNGAGGVVGDDDLAFLTLDKPQTLRVSIILASEKQVTEFKSKAIALKAIGYGEYTNSGTEKITFPKTFDGTYGSTNSLYSNSAYMVSKNGRSCAGDSGGPILNITATQVTLVGILTGTPRGANDKCGQKQSDGNYSTLFTVVGRYANLAFSAATDAMNSQDQALSASKSQLAEKDSQITKMNSNAVDLRNQLSTAQSELDTANQSLEDLQLQLDAANATIIALNRKLPQTIICIKGKLTKKVTGIMPKCPKGYAIKA